MAAVCEKIHERFLTEEQWSGALFSAGYYAEQSLEKPTMP